MSRRLSGLTVTRAPVGQEPQRSGQLVTGRGQLVHEPLWALAVRLRQHEPLALEPAKPLREHVRRYPRELLLEVAEAARAVEKGLDEQERPAIADAVERRREG